MGNKLYVGNLPYAVRDNDLLQVERIEVQPAARELLASDQFDLHPELLAAETARIARELGAG